MNRPPQESFSRFQQNIILRLVLYYAALALLAFVVFRFLPDEIRSNLNQAVQPLLGTSGFTPTFTTPDPAASGLAPHLVLIMAFIGSVSALLLAIPVSWVYMFTRQKKGYQQSVVHSLILLPVVVAMVAALVRNSIALAFSLAGIVAAVRFRTTLEDSKDAVFVFTVMALGLACGVQLEMGAVLSVLFVMVTMVLWYTDYARTPPALEGERAKRHMERAVAIANRTSQFVAKLDREILDAMAPAQLDALQARLERRRAKIEGKTEEQETDEEGPRFDGRLIVTVSDPEAAQPAIESLFEAQAKRWKLIRLERNDGRSRIVYAVRPKKGTTLETLAEVVERGGAPFVAKVEAERWN
ncbi:MAG TPA: DUF4956 domain-containing protein [Gemmatimonadaceae bacterium]|nr:DUF4956 domain-containing protein [Gemmatimonadaceae bacterium]